MALYHMSKLETMETFDNVLMKTYFLCGRRGDKKAFQEAKICGVIVSKLILFI